MDMHNETVRCQDTLDLTKWIMDMKPEEFNETFKRLSLKDTGNPQMNFFAMLRRLAGHYSVEDFEIDPDYESLSADELKVAMDALREDVVSDLAKTNLNLSRHLLGAHKETSDSDSDIGNQPNNRHQPRTTNNIQPQTNQTQQQPGTSNNYNNKIPVSPTDKNNPLNGLLTNENNKNFVPWQSTTGIIYELP